MDKVYEILEAITDFFADYPWILIALIAHLTILGTVAYLILLERKVASWVQDRIGPNRVGPFGLLQPIADGMKFIFKEDYRPAGVDKILFTLAPGLMILVVIVSIAVLPWGGDLRVTRAYDVSKQVARGENPREAALNQVPSIATPLPRSDATGHPLNRTREALIENVDIVHNGPQTQALVTYQYSFQIAKLNIGVLFILGVLALAIYGVVLGGWASNNKYSFLGALRATAQMISYEIPMGLCVLVIAVMFGTLDLGEIVDNQAIYWFGWIPAWNCFCQPITFLMFLVCIHAEANRAPFDMAEAEQELVGGYHTEYSSMRFALFFLGEYAGMITTSAVCVALFFGGWHIPWLDKLIPELGGKVDPAHPAIVSSVWVCILRSLVFFGKTLGIIFIFLWTRWSLPRFRFDQLMMIAWRAMIPMSLGLMLVTAVVIYLLGGQRDNMRVGPKMAFALLGANIALLIGSMLLSRVIPAAPQTNRRLQIQGSRFARA